jgi:hypothetical protein
MSDRFVVRGYSHKYLAWGTYGGFCLKRITMVHTIAAIQK